MGEKDHQVSLISQKSPLRIFPSSPLPWSAHTLNDTLENVQEKRSDGINNRGDIHLYSPFLRILKFPQLQSSSWTSCTNQYSTSSLDKTWVHLQTKTGASRGVSAWSRFERRGIALLPCWIPSEYGGPGGRGEVGQAICVVAPAQCCQQWDLSSVLNAEGQAKARDAKFYPQMLMSAGFVYEDRSQPWVFLFAAFKVSAEPVVTHPLLSNSEINCDFFFLAYESLSRAELCWSRQAYDSISESRVQASFTKANPKISLKIEKCGMRSQTQKCY